MKTKILKFVLPAIGLLALVGSAQAAEPYCREFSQQIVVGGKVRQGYGTACLQPNGSWQIVNAAQVTDDVALQSQAQAVEVQPEPEVQYVVQQPVVYEPVYRPDPFPVFLSLGYSNSWGHGWHGGGGHWHH